MSSASSQSDAWAFCSGILPDVSRSFALIIPACPEPINRALCVGYLICRIADTIEDAPAIADDVRETLYDRLLTVVATPTDTAAAQAFVESWPAAPPGDYGRLVENTDRVMTAYATLPDDLRTPLERCARDMIAGMRTMRPVEARDGVAFMCRDMAELETYCHYVAGTVGIMSTELFMLRLAPAGFKATDAWREEGRRLGLGLQMTNIIKDRHVDAARGVSYVPAACVDFNQPGYQLYHVARSDLLGRAIGHLDVGLRYSLAIPAEETGIRTFLLGSLLPAIATLEVAAPGTEPQPKISRAKMTEIFTQIEDHGTDNEAINAWYLEHRRRTRALLTAAQ